MPSAAVNKVPPDGGYGWVVTFAYALNNFVVLPLISSFGLVFQEAFPNIGLSATLGTLVIALNHGLGMFISFFGGPVLKRFGYRKVAVTGAILIATGLMLTSVASSLWVFILSYSIFTSMGVAAVMSAFTLAINSFFKDKRGRAIGAGMSVTGLGAICMPLVMGGLMSAYGWRYAVLILGAICLHSLVAACLLRPAKWYLRNVPIIEEMVPLNKEASIELINGSVTTSSKQNGNPSIRQLEESVENGIPPPKSLSMRSLTSAASLETRNAISHPDIRKKNPESLLSESRYKWWESQEINLGSSINIFNEPEYVRKPDIKEKEILEDEKKSFLDKFIALFDLTLLSDSIFVNILIGMSIAAGVESAFATLLPFILNDMMKFETEDIAKVMSVIGFSDTLFRLVSPFIGEWCNKSPRAMYIISLLLTVFTRTIMLFTSSFTGMLVLALAMGVTKGVRTVYMNIVIPSYVPLERLPFASGIQMFVSGIFIMAFIGLSGVFRETSGSYQISIVVLNILTLVTVSLWTAEFTYFRIKNRNRGEQVTTT